MSIFVTLSCPSCGGKLDITSDLDRFACAHCGREHIVKRGGGVISLAPITDSLKRVQAGIDRTASELAIQRLEKEISELEQQIENVKLVKSNDHEIGFTFVAILLLAAGFFLIGLNSLILAILFSFAASAVLLYEFQRFRSLTSQTKDLLSQIEKKRADLQRHRSIVDS